MHRCLKKHNVSPSQIVSVFETVQLTAINLMHKIGASNSKAITGESTTGSLMVEGVCMLVTVIKVPGGLGVVLGYLIATPCILLYGLTTQFHPLS